MNTSVCVSVCLSSRISPRNLYQIFDTCCLWPWLGPPPSRWRNRKGIRGILRIVLPIDSALYIIAFETHAKTAEPIKMPFVTVCDNEWLGQRNSVLRGVAIPEGQGAILGKHMPDTPNTPKICELDWSLQRLAQDRGRCLIASMGRVYYRPRGIVQHRGEVLFTIALFVLLVGSVQSCIFCPC